jgi:putative DNA primase/helicase
MTLVICADDDHVTDGNPGLTKAAEAAQAVKGLLAIPRFPETREDSDTDFNDLACLAGRVAVINCVETALRGHQNPSSAEPEHSDYPFDAIIQKLSKLSPLQYDQVRRQEAKALGVRPATLDAAVTNASKGPVAENLPFAEVEPWPDAVDPAQLLTEIASTVRRFIICDRDTAHADALWAAMT